MSKPIFNEESLGDAIGDTFGKFGAHAEVYRDLLKRIEVLKADKDIMLGVISGIEAKVTNVMPYRHDDITTASVTFTGLQLRVLRGIILSGS